MAKDSMMTTSRASLCALGEYLRRQCCFAPLREQVQMPQKTVRYPSDRQSARCPVGDPLWRQDHRAK
jgi:hypothetical protein